MLPHFKTAAIASVTALSLALASAAPANALGRNERNFLKGVAATLIVGALINSSRNRTPEPQPAPTHAPSTYRAPTYNPPTYNPPARYVPPAPPANTGAVIGSSTSVYNTNAARAFNSYGSADRRAIQSRLRAYGYYRGTIDGAFGPATYRAIVAYARDTNGEANLGTIAGTYGVFDGLLA